MRAADAALCALRDLLEDQSDALRRGHPEELDGGEAAVNDALALCLATAEGQDAVALPLLEEVRAAAERHGVLLTAARAGALEASRPRIGYAVDGKPITGAAS